MANECDEKRISALVLWSLRRVLRIIWTEYKTNVWEQQKIGVPEENGLVEKLKNGGWPNTGTAREEVNGWLWL